jgi:hypothetical protein
MAPLSGQHVLVATRALSPRRLPRIRVWGSLEHSCRFIALFSAEQSPLRAVISTDRVGLGGRDEPI